MSRPAVPEVLRLPDASHPTRELIEECLERVLRGELLAGPTDTVYGLFCDPFNGRALERLVALKGERQRKPIPLLVSGREQASRLVATIPPAAERLIRAFWPGGLTIVLPALPHLPRAVTATTSTVGLRQPESPYLLMLLEALGGPLTGTSANRAARRPATTAGEVLEALSEEVDAVVDGGAADRLEGSTVLEVGDRGLRVLREGIVTTAMLAAVPGLQGLQGLRGPPEGS